MLVHDIMTKDVICIPANLAISAVNELMQANNVRHFPVMEADKLVGMVSDRDLGRLGANHSNPNTTSPVITPADPVRQIMTRPVITAAPREPIEEAAKVLRRHKIGALPVMDGDTLVGIVTGIDFLDALITLTGVHQAASRLEVVSEPAAAILRLAEAVNRQGVELLSALSYPHAEHGLCVVARVNTINNHQLAQQLRAEGFQVLWPQPKADL
jgi:acetoin utilization protein AcuB